MRGECCEAVHVSDAFDHLAALLDERWTCRQFLSDPVPPEDLSRLLALAQRSPSWCNTQPWQVEVTSGEATTRLREALVAHVLANPQQPDFDWPASYPGAYGERRRECGFQLYDALGIARDDKDARFRQLLRNFELFDAPHLLLVTTEAELGTWGALDCGTWLQTLLLGAQALGLGVAPQAALAAYAPFFRDHFGLADSRRVVVGISLGYPETSAPVNAFRTSRAGLSDAVRWHS